MARERKSNLTDSYTTHQLAPLLGVTCTTVIAWCNKGKIKYKRTLGGHRRISVDEYKRIAELMEIDEKVDTEETEDKTDKPNSKTLYPINRYISKKKQ